MHQKHTHGYDNTIPTKSPTVTVIFIGIRTGIVSRAAIELGRECRTRFEGTMCKDSQKRRWRWPQRAISTAKA